MSATRTQHPAHRQIADALAWLRAHVALAAGLHADTRSLKPGDVFLAYAVEGADNRPHIANAIERGAVAVLYQPEGYAGEKLDASIALAVPQLDVLAGEIASGWYGDPSDAMLVVGVTGTNGKTSCSQWIASAFTAIGQKCAIVGTLGTGFPGQLVHTGFTTPDAPQLQRSLAQLRSAGAQAIAMEVSSHALHQGRVNGTSFDIAVFTNLTQDHLDYHHTFEAYEAAKARLFAWPGLRAAIINADDAAGRRRGLRRRSRERRAHHRGRGVGRRGDHRRADRRAHQPVLQRAALPRPGHRHRAARRGAAGVGHHARCSSNHISVRAHASAASAST